MSVGAPEQIAWTDSPEAALLDGATSDSLIRAFKVVHGLAALITKDAGEDLPPDELSMRMVEAGEWTAKDFRRDGSYPEAAAVRVLAGAAYYARVQRRLSQGSPGEWRSPLIQFTCGYNRRIRTYGMYDPAARTSELLTAVAAMDCAVDPAVDAA